MVAILAVARDAELEHDLERRDVVLREAGAAAAWFRVLYPATTKLLVGDVSPFWGIDRSIAPASLQNLQPKPPLTIETFQRAMRMLLEGSRRPIRR